MRQMDRRTSIGVAAGLAAVTSISTTAPGLGGSFIGTDEFGTGATIPLAWGDFDDDGDFDLAVGNYFGQPNELYVNHGSNTFERQTPFGSGLTFAVAWADYDNDGDLDLAVGNNGENWLYTQGPPGTFVQTLEFGMNRTVAIAWGDADNDGDLDLAVGNGILGVAQQNYLYVNNGDGSFTELARFGAGQTDSLAWGDGDGDGDLDLAVGNGGFGSAGQNYLYLNSGSLMFTEHESFGMGDTAVVAWGDADSDGDLDLAVGNWETGANALYIGNGDGTFTMQTAFGDRDTNTVAWGDYDLDGDLDLAVGNGDFTRADQNFLYVNDGRGSFTEVAEFGTGSTDGVGWADSDGDGDLDLAVGNEHTPTQNQLFVNQLADRDWLRIELTGRFHAFGGGYSNRDGIGGVLSVYAPGHPGEPAHLLGCRQVEAAGGFHSQNAMAVTFGVPGRATVDLQIEWPGSDGSSITQNLFAVDIDQAITVQETRPGDFNDNGLVAFTDLLALLAAWGPCPGCPEDLDGDGVVGFADLLLLLTNWT